MSKPCALTLLAILTLPLTACRSTPTQTAVAPQPQMKPAPSTPIEVKREEIGGDQWNPQWDALIERDLPPDMLSAQAARAVHSYCPNFANESEADKRAFWAYLFQALAGAEAGLTPTADVHHTQSAVNRTDKLTHLPIRQEGLLQVAYEDAQNYGCDFDWQHDRTLPAKDPNRTILQPANNLACGIKIMDNQIIQQHKPLLSRTSYWSTLQPASSGYRVFAKQMANVPPACGLHPHVTAHRPTD
jgi:hypothetical protein